MSNKLGQRARGAYWKFFAGENFRTSVPFNGVVIHDTGDGAYVVLTDDGEEVLVELYEQDTIEFERNYIPQ